MGAMGFQAGRLKDMSPTRGAGSDQTSSANFLANLRRRPHAGDERRGWGKNRPNDEGQFRDVGFQSNLHEDLATDQGRVDHVQDVRDTAGQRGLEAWKKQHSGDMRASASPKRYPKVSERQDLPAWQQWLIPPKSVRLEHVLDERERRLQKTPDYDLMPHVQHSVQKIWDGLEVAMVKYPLPFARARENFCVTHVECLNTRSLELFIVCWQLTMDQSERSKYHTMLGGALNTKWAHVINKHFDPSGGKSLRPQLRFVYDDGTIPFKASIVEQNLMRAQRGLAPLDEPAPYSDDLWSITSSLTSEKARRRMSHEQSNEGDDPVSKFLAEARAAIEPFSSP